MLVFPSFSYAVGRSGYHINKNMDLVPNDRNGNRKVILITVDDGPTKRAISIMDILIKHQAKAIIFINGTHNKDAPNVITEEAKAGFIIGNHTWNHLNLKKEKNDKIKKEIDDTSKLIIRLTGTPPKFFRPPYGVSNPYIKDLAKKDGMILMNWSGSALDWEEGSKDEKVFIKNVMDDLHPGEILLIHEHPWTVKYLDNLLTVIKQEGYTFVNPDQITE